MRAVHPPESLLRVTEHNRHLGVLARVALLVAVGDWVTKSVASRAVEGEIVLSERLRFAVVHNDAAAFGFSAGAYTWQLNLALTLAAIVFMIPVSRELTRIDEAAPRALGLIMGGALGNLASLVSSPQGVVDFISVSVAAHSEVVLNVADIAAYIGLAMVVRTGFLIVAELRRSALPRPITLVDVPGVRAWRAPVVGSDVPVHPDREVPVPPDREVPVPVSRSEVYEDPIVVDSTPRPESVRRAQLADATESDARVIDIRPHLALQQAMLRDAIAKEVRVAD